MNKPKAIIVDVDGTLADMRGVRKPFDWDKVHLDRPHQDIINLVNELASVREIIPPGKSFREMPLHIYESHLELKNQLKYKIIITTGRDGVCEQATKDWLTDNGVMYDDFYIRPEGDFRKDNIIKSEIYMDHIRPKYDVAFVIDDRDQVVKMWRTLGLRVLQVAPGDF